MKAIQLDEGIKVFNELPVDWKNYLNFKEAPIELQQQEGFYDVIVPSYDEVTQKLGEIYFDEVLKVFTYPILLNTLPTLAEAKVQKIEELKSAVRDIYLTVQWYVEMKRMEDEVIPTVVKNKIRLIKTRYEQAKAQINALTTVVDVLNWKVPYAQIENIKADLNSIN